ncbi:MAG TPA: M23 family metallopeptidase [Vicinamibacterales bacterium]
MKRARRGGSPVASALLACTAIGFGLGWALRGHAPRPAEGLGASEAVAAAPAPTRAESQVAPKSVATSGASSAIDEVRQHDLRVPIDGAVVQTFKGQFADRRENGNRPHEAVDILVPRNTPVHAVESGTIAKLFFSKGGGGNTIYEYDPSERYCYYYAHLERYADGLKNGQRVARGDVIGFVGTSGNAPPNTPHLHFAVFALGPTHQWWKGRPLDPYLVFSR